jgi:pimeloyl-ACP methyl ester carboxylesterase
MTTSQPLHVVEHAPRESALTRPVVVFVHGMLDSGDAFAPMQALLPECSLVYFDRRGYGRSLESRRVAESMCEHVRDVVSVIDGRRVTLVGHSAGGAIALAVAAARPDLVTSLGVYEPGVQWAPWWPPDRRTMRADHEQRLLAGYDDPEHARWAQLAHHADVATLATAPFEWSDITVPCVVGRGSESPDFLRNSAENVATVIGAELFEIPGGAHYVHRRDPQAFAGLVRRAVDLSGHRDT